MMGAKVVHPMATSSIMGGHALITTPKQSMHSGGCLHLPSQI